MKPTGLDARLYSVVSRAEARNSALIGPPGNPAGWLVCASAWLWQASLDRPTLVRWLGQRPPSLSCLHSIYFLFYISFQCVRLLVHIFINQSTRLVHWYIFISFIPFRKHWFRFQLLLFKLFYFVHRDQSPHPFESWQLFSIFSLHYACFPPPTLLPPSLIHSLPTSVYPRPLFDTTFQDQGGLKAP